MGKYKDFFCKSCGGTDFRICDQKRLDTRRNKIYIVKALVCKECLCRRKWMTQTELKTINLEEYK